MKQFKVQDITVNVCRDIIEWAKEFYEMPEGAELANKDEVSSKCMGFAQIDDKEIWLFIPADFNNKQVMEVVAHEIGHLMDFPLATPEQIDENDELHEKKADHYMNYFSLVMEAYTKIFCKQKGTSHE